jgi:hypothetical protein
MSIQIEKDLRDALSDQAAKLPSDVSDGVLARDFHPRGSAGRMALAIGTLTLAAAIGFAVSVVGLGSDPPRAFAGWSATPTAATSAQINKARSVCHTQLTRMSEYLLPSLAAEAREHRALSAPAIPVDAWHTVLIDTRGPYTLILFEAEHGRATSVCFGGGRYGGALGTGLGVRPPAPVAAGRAVYGGSGSSVTPRSEGSHHFSWVIGRTGAGVDGVTIRLNNGTRVAASRVKGWFLAWWPGSHGIRATEVTTAAGTKDQ